MRIVDYTSIALKDLRTQPVRSGLTIFALVISTVILVVMAAISIGGRQAISDQFGSDQALTNISVTPNQSSGGLSLYGSVQEVNTNANKLDDATVTRLAALPHTQLVTPRSQIWEFNSFSLSGSTKQYVAQAQGVSNGAQLDLQAGMMFSSNDQTHVVIMGSSYAKVLGYGGTPRALLGKTITIVTQKGYRGDGAVIPVAGASKAVNDAFAASTTKIQATIVGVTNNGPDQNDLFIPIGWAHSVRSSQYNESTGLKTIDQIASDGYSSIQVRADSTADVQSVSDSIQHLGYGVVSTLSQIQRLQQFSTMMWIILGAVALIAVIAAALGVVNTMLMAVSEQRYTIGVWRAFGARKSFIMRLFLVEAALLGFIGGAIGVAIGIAVSRVVNQYVDTLLKSQGLTIVNIAVIPGWLIVGTITLTTIFGVLAGLYPAYRAARQDPSRALSSGQ